MKEIVVISGKGGTGKTSITASFAMLGADKVVVGDCDVDAADLHLLLKPDFAHKEDFYLGKIAEINTDECIMCGICLEMCKFNAIKFNRDRFEIAPLECEGCGYCSRICPEKHISMKDRLTGELYVSTTKNDNPMVHAKLAIGAENSGKMVAKVKNVAVSIAKRTNKDYVIIDGSPGVGCPVISSLSGADFVVLVTEPTVSGMHDLKRVYALIKKFGIKAGCIINKHDLNDDMTKQIKVFLSEENITHLSSLPYDDSFTAALTNGKTIVEYSNGIIRQSIVESWEKILEIVGNEN